ncbi:MAG: endopeptidase La [Desulfovibrionaceae bacterium]|nr:endopeptidase La [Desulfovibrionaceae bacterium]
MNDEHKVSFSSSRRTRKAQGTGGVISIPDKDPGDSPVALPDSSFPENQAEGGALFDDAIPLPPVPSPEYPDSQDEEKDSEETEEPADDSDANDRPDDQDTPKRPRRRVRRPSAVTVSLERPSGMDSTQQILAEIPSTLPVVPLRDNVVFNSMIVPLYESRERSILAVDTALGSNRFLLLCTQKDASVDEPSPDDLFAVGSVVMILRMLKLPDGQVKILVQGLARAQIRSFVATEPFMVARAEILREKEAGPHDVRQEALIRSAREQSEKILNLRGIPTGDIMGVLMAVDDPGRLADLIAANMRLRVSEAQALLECLDPMERLRMVNDHLSREVEVADMQARIQNMAREGMDKAQKDYFLREQMKAIRRELGDNADQEEELEELGKALDKAGLPPEARKEADKQLRRLAAMHGDSAEASVIRTYLDWLADLPWKKVSRDRLDIVKAKEILDEDHFGLARIKDRILEYLSVRKLNPDSKGPILCFVGPPGVGKTSLGRSIARAMGRKFQRISLGGMRDEAEIRGHRRTYIGSMPGRVIQAVKQAGTRNPVLVLDEIDKLGSDFRGDPSSALLEVLDPEQNSHFSDHYLNLEFDLSRVLFLCTANQLDTIPSALLDRLEVISLPGYTEQEKLTIAKKYLVPRQRGDNGLKEADITVRDAAIARIIREYTREAGLRNLERQLGTVCRKLARRKAEGQKGPFVVAAAQVPKLLGAPRYLDEERENTLMPGVALGLAWTQAGGEVLHVEVSTMKGTGHLTLTGQLGDVMKESAQAALSYARSHAEHLGIEPDFADKLDIHVHVPAGATPKDGPSAGVTMVTALVSALTGRPARTDTCMTGEITLRGRVLPVGGIKEKILGAVARGLQHAVIPSQNVKDLEEIPADLRRRIDIRSVDSIDELLPLVLTDKAKAAHRQSTPEARKAWPAAKQKKKAAAR